MKHRVDVGHPQHIYSSFHDIDGLSHIGGIGSV